MLLARYIIAAIPILLICTYSPSVIDPVLVPRTFVLSALLLILSFFVLFNNRREAALPSQSNLRIHLPLLLVICLYLGLSSLGVFRGVNQAEAIFDWSKTLLMLPLFLLITSTLNESEEAKISLLKGVLIAGFIAQFIGLYQLWDWMFSNPLAEVNIATVSSTLANKNLYSSFIILTIPIGFLAYKLFTKMWRIIALSYLVITAYNAIILQTRAGWLALVISAFVLLIVFLIADRKEGIQRLWEQLKQTKKHIAVFVILLAGLITSSTLLKPDLVADTYQKTVYIVENPNSKEVKYGSVGNRIDMWSHTFEMYKDEPLLGNGLASWKFLLPAYGQIGRKTEQGRMYFQRPHNDFLWVFAELGTLGGITYLALFLLPFIMLLRLLFKRTDEDKSSAYLLLFGLSLFGIISCFSFPRERIVHLLLLVLYLALIVQQYGKFYPKRMKRISGIKQSLVWSLCALLMGFVVMVSFFRMSGEKHTHQVYEAAGKNDLSSIIASSEAALNPFYSVDPVSTPMHWYIGIAYAEEAQYEKALPYFQTAMQYHPNHLLVLNNLASCLHLTGQTDSAVYYYNRALQISPRFSESLCNLSILFLNQGQIDKALATIEQCPLDEVLPPLHDEYLHAILKEKYAPLASRMTNVQTAQNFSAFLEEKRAVIRAYMHCKTNNLDMEIYLISRFM